MRKKLIYFLILVVMGGGLVVGIKSLKQKGHNHAAQEKKQALYFCPMHPHITSEKPGRCPICGMDLQKSEEETSPSPTQDVSERSSFKLTPERQKLIGVASTKVIEKELSYDVRASGKVAFDPDLFTAIEEYRQALSTQEQMGESSFQDLKEDALQMIKSAQTKLELMGLTLDQIQVLADPKTDSMSLLLPKGKAWIYAEVFEYEISGIQEGQTFHVEVPALPGKMFMGTVSSISPVLNAPSRTFRVRGEVSDPEGHFRPDTFVNVKIKVEFGLRKVVPRDAVLHSGDESFVFVIQDENNFEPRKVNVGIKTKEYIEILSGVEAGDVVVTGANFLIDSESRLRSVLKNLGKKNDAAPVQPSGHGGH